MVTIMILQIAASSTNIFKLDVMKITGEQVQTFYRRPIRNDCGISFAAGRLDEKDWPSASDIASLPVALSV